jgi:uncharacterized membrane protein
MSSNLAGLLAYILGFITGIILLVTEPYKNDKFVRFHAFQSIFFDLALVVLCVALIVFWIAFWIVASILGFLSLRILAVAGAAGLGILLSLAIAYWIFLMYKAYNNECYKIPFIGDLAAKQAG